MTPAPQEPKKKTQAQFEAAEEILMKAMRYRFGEIKHHTNHPSRDIVALEVYCPPITMTDTVRKIRLILPNFNVHGFTNHSYILIS